MVSTAFWWSWSNLSKLAQALQRIIEDIDLAQRLGEEARTTIMREYQLINVINKHIEIYRRPLTRGQNALPLVLEGERNNE